MAAGRGRLGAARALLAAGANVEARDAVRRRLPGTRDRLPGDPTRSTQANTKPAPCPTPCPRVRPQDGRTPLLLALSERHLSVARALLDTGADPRAISTGADGASPLGLVLSQYPEEAMVEAAEMLIGHGADVESADPSVRTPLPPLSARLPPVK